MARTARISSLSSIVLRASPTASPTLMPALRSSSAAARSRGFSLMLEVNCTSLYVRHSILVSVKIKQTYPCTLVRLLGALHGFRVLELLYISLELLHVVLELPIFPQFVLENLHKRLEWRFGELILTTGRSMEFCTPVSMGGLCNIPPLTQASTSFTILSRGGLSIRPPPSCLSTWLSSSRVSTTT